MTTYTNEAALQTRLNSERLAELLDRDEDGSPDSGVLDKAISRAGSTIRRRLRQRYGSAVDSIAAITDSPATPSEIQEVAEDLVLADLYSFWNPEGLDARYHRSAAEDAIKELQDGGADFDIARADAKEGRRVAVYTAEDNVFSGQDSDSVSNTSGI